MASSTPHTPGTPQPDFLARRRDALLNESRSFKTEGNTYKAMLTDTLDFLESLTVPASQKVALEAQIEAIRRVLTSEPMSSQ